MKEWWAAAPRGEKRDEISRALSVNNGSHLVTEVRAKQSAAAKERWRRAKEQDASVPVVQETNR